ncbi:FG-GAP repeat protein [Tuwongella immobilis]|uniref:VCBS repeat-containing protein n=1 Tax=Tuwongella immobilis TaxID=692036 RepID=A0A6C2YT72_9BACT|nr:FG-GAP repeat protein [Tuwongella immobilis]VIP04082.1 Hemolysin-type calcium-binding region domain protein OS=Rhodopirellula maiorica SM1 GN=RMSM_03614 PE=4 SV=1: FG-GAP [Tuwongella immobilis]VTS05531.1 Hemolysin-type calcium-binding region domain protein OS=Rhodopirellula maiorica SM1 GN=RMSM_03614 PE=4 SV=1: FG-GAP [Tuwongella immobilis]
MTGWFKRLLASPAPKSVSSSARRNQPLRLERLEGREVPAALGVYALAGGEGTTPRVQIYDAATNFVIADFQPFEATFTGGVNVALGDINQDGFPDVIVGAGPGGGPRIRVFEGSAVRNQGRGFNPNLTSNVLADFFAYESSQRGGVYVAAGNFFGLSNEELVVGAGPGGGPRVRVLDGLRISLQGRNFTSETPGDTVANFFAFESTFRNGVTVAANSVSVGFSNLVVAPGLGGAPRVRLLSGAVIGTKLEQFTSLEVGDTIADFFADNSNNRTGLFVTYADMNVDAQPDIIVAPATGTARIQIFSGLAIQTQRTQFNGARTGDKIDDFTIAPVAGYANGATVGAALSNAGADTLLVGTGAINPATPAQLRGYRYSSGANGSTRTQTFTLNLFQETPNRINAGP